MWTDAWSALGTVGATFAAVVLGGVSLYISVRDHIARRRQDDDRAEAEHWAEQRAMRSQAERVACWLQVDTNQYPNHKIIIVNASDQPIWDVSVNHWSLGNSQFAQIPVMPPGERKEIPSVPKPDGLTIEEAVDVRFKDNGGRGWFRPAMKPGKLILESEPRYQPPAPLAEKTSNAE